MKIIHYVCLFPLLIQACVDHSPSDPRRFHCETLDNGLSMVVVEDPQAENAAAAMYVGVGTENDPQGLEGLAHFLEHMLFIGTEEYPEVDALSHFVTSRGGGYNAFTARDHTQYFFSVKPESFQEAFNIFSSFFIKPLLSQEYVDRERHAVHAEFKIHQEEDGWREHMINAITGNPEHPANRFSIGNLDTLSECEDGALRAALVKFYETYYSAKNMYFVAVTPDASDQAVSLIKERLGAIPTFDLFQPKFPNRIDEKSNARFIQYKTLQDSRELSLQFRIPSQKLYYLSPAVSYISSLVGDEGDDSLLANLKEKGYATGLSAGAYEISDKEDLFQVSISLTPEGYNHYDDVVAAVIQTIELIRSQGVSLDRFHQMQRVGYLHYLYPNYQSPMRQVNSLVANMPHYPNRMLIKRNYITDESIFDAQHIYQVLNDLRLDNARIWLSAPDVETTQTEPIFGAEYSDRAISTEEVVNWFRPRDYHIKLPGKNPFLPDNVTLYQGSEMIKPSKKNSRWYMADYQFGQPKRFLATQLVTSPITSAEDTAALELMAGILNFQTTEHLYPAAMAGLSWGVDTNWLGLVIHSSGLGDKQPQLVDYLLSSIKAMDEVVSDDVFSMVQQKQLESLDAMQYEPPYLFANRALGNILRPGGQDIIAYRKALQSITPKGLQDFIRRHFSQVAVRSFYYGNVTERDAQQYQPNLASFNLTNKGLDKTPNQLLSINEDEKAIYITNSQKDYASLSYIQMPGSRYVDKASALVLAKMIHSPMFQELRTEEQIGYAVSCRYLPVASWPAVVFLIQSPTVNPEAIYDRVKMFLQAGSFWDKTAFKTIKNALIKEMLEPHKTMDAQFGDYWDKISNTSLAFDAREKLSEALKQLTYDDVQQYYQKHFIDHPKWLQVYVNQSKQEDSIDDFKVGHQYMSSVFE
ncbi:MAG: insulinase family protein [Pseudomonadota bacterium]|nr:insulinase family protein [Pseudomonadota bacterium]